MFVVDDAHEVVVELGAGEVGVVGGVVALAAEDGDELGAGLEAAALADGLEPAVEFEGSGAVAVAEEPPVPRGCVPFVGERLHLRRFGFDAAGGVEVLVGDHGVGDAGVDKGHPR